MSFRLKPHLQKVILYTKINNTIFACHPSRVACINKDKENRIIAVKNGPGIEAYQGPDTMVIEAGDQLVMPGFNDRHTHLTQGAFLEDPDFSANSWNYKR